MVIYQTARYEVKPEALAKCKRAIRLFVDYVKANEPGTFRYIAMQDKEHPTRFEHFFIFENAAAQRKYSTSDAVEKFTGILYPNCVGPVEFTEYSAVNFKGETIRSLSRDGRTRTVSSKTSKTKAKTSRGGKRA